MAPRSSERPARAQIRQHETRLGVPLLTRSTRAVTLTEAGRTLCDRGPAALAGVRQAWEAARQTGAGRGSATGEPTPASPDHPPPLEGVTSSALRPRRRQRLAPLIRPG